MRRFPAGWGYLAVGLRGNYTAMVIWLYLPEIGVNVHSLLRFPTALKMASTTLLEVPEMEEIDSMSSEELIKLYETISNAVNATEKTIDGILEKLVPEDQLCRCARSHIN